VLGLAGSSCPSHLALGTASGRGVQGGCAGPHSPRKLSGFGDFAAGLGVGLELHLGLMSAPLEARAARGFLQRTACMCV